MTKFLLLDVDFVSDMLSTMQRQKLYIYKDDLRLTSKYAGHEAESNSLQINLFNYLNRKYMKFSNITASVPPSITCIPRT